MQFDTLIIAFGNRLRGDDGVGPAVGDIVQTWQMPGVRVLIVHQLVPELIEDMKNARRILLVDAAADIPDNAVSIVLPQRERHPLGHHETPANLLALLQAIENRVPSAWLLRISAISFDHGQPLSQAGAVNARKALVWIRDWLAQGESQRRFS